MADQLTTDDTFDPTDKHAIVEAFIDGEAVEAALLKDALAHAGARDHLVDLLMIRRAVGAMDAAASTSLPATRPAVRSAGAKWFTAAAAAVLVSLTVGYAAGQRLVARSSDPAAVEVMLPTQPHTSAPAPTRSIAFIPGVNWTEHAGGR